MGVECSLFKLILKIETQIIVAAAVGSTISAESNILDKYNSTNKRSDRLIVKRMYSPWLYPEFIFKIYLYLMNQSTTFTTLRAPFFEAIKQRKRIILERKNTATAESDYPVNKTILDDLLESTDLTEHDLTDEIMTLVFAGSDTTATTICFTLLMLAMNPNIQEKVFQELYAVFGEKDESIDLSDLHKLTFLEQCLKETLRMYSAIPIIIRHATTDVVLSDGRTIPAGANVILSIRHIHDNSEYYPNPEIWNPHNFDPDKVAQRPINSFIPFAVGCRMCVGYKYAMISMKILLSYILRNFKLSTSQTEINLQYYILVKCVNGFHIKFEKR